MTENNSTTFFTVGGTLNRKAGSYITRPADQDLLNKVLGGEYCNVLTARQMGKSSLMVRTSEALKNNQVKPVIIDLTSIGSEVTSEEWYFGLITRLQRSLNIGAEIREWWKARGQQSPVQRFQDFLRDVVLEEIKEPVVIFLDEIDSTLQLAFTDDFFAVIRSTYNARAEDPAYNRLTFVLLGVARPNDLIKDRNRTPYNIGYNIQMTDFKLEELVIYQDYLDSVYPGQGKEILTWILEWSGGQPYLTQKLCSETVNLFEERIKESDIDQLVLENFLGEKARTETNIRSIADRVRASKRLDEILVVYQKVLSGKKIKLEEHSVAHNELKLCGLVGVAEDGTLFPRNRIYSTVFNKSWVKNTLPKSNTRRIAVISSVVAVLAIAIAAYFIITQRARTVEVQAEVFEQGFTGSSSVDVRLTNLAGLFELGGEYAERARELYAGLSHEEQLALFQSEDPGTVGNELYVTISGTYQYTKNDEEGNAVLQAMLDVLNEITVSGSTDLILEIELWLQARDLTEQEQYSAALTLYDNAYTRSQNRGAENLRIILERGLVQSALGSYDEAAQDYEYVLLTDESYTNQTVELILADQPFWEFLLEHENDYITIHTVISIPTPTATATPDATQTKTLTPTPTYTPTPKYSIGSTMVSPKDNMPMVYVPEGEFIMGLSEEDYESSDDITHNVYLDHSPQHTVYLDAYWIDQTEVTNAMFVQFLNEMGYDDYVSGKLQEISNPEGTWISLDESYANKPVIVNWSGAAAYCEWAGRRLPTEAEWEKAYRGTEGQLYPWGNESPDVNWLGWTSTTWTGVVGLYPQGASPYGALDMAGNAREWVSDWYTEDYYQSSPYENPQGPDSGVTHVVRGAQNDGWDEDGIINNPSVWGYRIPIVLGWYNNYHDCGFRCAISKP